MQTAKAMFIPLIFGLCATSAAFAEDHYKNGQDITGSWRIVVTVQPEESVAPA